MEDNSKKLGLKELQETNENWIYSTQIIVSINTSPLEFPQGIQDQEISQYNPYKLTLQENLHNVKDKCNYKHFV